MVHKQGNILPVKTVVYRKDGPNLTGLNPTRTLVANSQHLHFSVEVGGIKSEVTGNARQFATSINKPVTRGNRELVGSKT